MKTLIKNGLVITMNSNKDIKKMDVLINDDKIQCLETNYNGQYDKLIDATNKIVMPGLINTHTHLGMSIFRGTSDGLSLMNWLNNKIWPLEDKLTDKDVYYSTLLSCVEMIKTGTTTSADDYFGVKEAIKAIEETNLRCLYTRCLMDSDNKGEQRLDEFINLIKNNNELITFSLAPHSLYTCSYDYLKEIKKISDKNHLIVHIHCAENIEEIKTLKEKYNMTPIELLDDLGYLDNKLLLAHGTYLTDNDIKLLKNKDITIVHNPISNLNLGCGIAPIKDYLDNGINVSLGTDGAGSGNNLNLFNHMGYVDLLQKGLFKDAKAMDAYQVLQLATINGAKALGMEDKIGSIELGKKADLILLDMSNIEIYPTVNLIFDIVHNLSPINIDTTIVNGEILMQNHKLLLNIDEENLKKEINKIISRIGE